ncbi:isochorismatase family protein [Cupriavidus nantongensis]|uniref:isochorismatase family protein n=1 Tax=Cupriavidus nantongensis TaxID=1796606 RepID=UPI00358E2CD4
MKNWDTYLTTRDKAVFEQAGYGTRAGFGARPALVIVDVNYSFCGHRSEPVLDSIKAWPNSCGEEAWEAIGHLQQVLEVARRQHIPVFYTTANPRRPDGFDAGGWKRKNKRAGGPIGVPGYHMDQIVAEVAPVASDVVIEKLKPSAFFGTPLIGYLTDLGVDTVLVCGSTTGGCVRATVIDAFSYNFRVSVIEECTFDRGQASHAINLFDMNAKYADVVSARETMTYLDGLDGHLFDEKIGF